jgi:hypothetical protein
MNFRTFLKQHAQEQPDPRIAAFLKIFFALPEVPTSSDPRALAEDLYIHLNEEATTGYQSCLLFYSEDPSNQLPAELRKNPAALLDAVNLIVELQNNDPNWKR